MTIALLPLLVEALPMVGGALVGLAACGFVYLKRKRDAEATAQQNLKTSIDTKASVTPPKQDSPKPTTVAAEIVADTAPEVIAETVVATAENSTQTLAEEPMLKRHHLSNIRMMLVETTFPRPTDSTLARHYDEMIDAKAEDCLDDDLKMKRLLAAYESYQNRKSSVQTAAPAAPTQITEKSAILPEDATLRRHFLTQLRATIEKNKAPRPSDSALRRHYDAMINAELENHLAHQ